MHVLPKLPYDFDALEPFIDAKTMEIHYTKHHQGYVDKLNAALQEHPEFQNASVEDLVINLDAVPALIRGAVRNQGGGHLNHSFFWPIMKNDRQKPDGKIEKAIIKKFGSYEKFKSVFSAAAAGVFGSGWAWLVVSDSGSNGLEVVSTSNQDNPISQGKRPILGLDVWEHAYYLKYQNRRPEYIEAWFNLINWEKVNQHYEEENGQ